MKELYTKLNEQLSVHEITANLIKQQPNSFAKNAVRLSKALYPKTFEALGK